jgi:hypothetical protein
MKPEQIKHGHVVRNEKVGLSGVVKDVIVSLSHPDEVLGYSSEGKINFCWPVADVEFDTNPERVIREFIHYMKDNMLYPNPIINIPSAPATQNRCFTVGEVEFRLKTFRDTQPPVPVGTHTP